MRLSSLVLCLSLGALVKCAAGSKWCYTGCHHTPSNWVEISHYCAEDRQSPIDIDTRYVETDDNLHNFTFVNFSSQTAIKSVINNGHTVKFNLEADEVEVSGGGLNATYSVLQFHFHWGSTEHHPGSEHLINGHRYPMEMHIVSQKKGLNTTEAKKDSEGFAVLGFFINATEDGKMMGPWDMLTNNLTNENESSAISIKPNISIHDLIGDVDLTKFYRYMGSFTTPDCNKAVVWTVFHEPINIHKDLIERFPKTAGFTNAYRPTQKLNGRQVFASPATPLPPSHPWCYDDHHCEYTPSHWYKLHHSHCGDHRQSPINIETKRAVIDEHLGAFSFVNFNDKHTIKHIENTGHTVKCVLKEGMVEVSGGGLKHVYSTLQFHFHWGSESHDMEGSEHMVDSHRYPMEMHIVNKRKDLSLDEAKVAPNGLAVLGFFIEAPGHTKSRSSSSHSSSSDSHTPETHPSSNMEAWKKLTDYLSAIQNISSQANVTAEISIDDLLGDVNRNDYYRYNGSLTTPSCNEAVVWTVFKESVKVDHDLMKLFPTKTGYHDVFRPAQSLHNRTVYTSSSARSSPGPVILFVLLACVCASFI